MSSVQNFIDQNINAFQNQLFELLRIPSISTDPDRKNDIREAAVFLKNQMEQMGMDGVELYETRGYPILYAEKITDETRPTVLVYGHYDVQPPDPLGKWHTPPFEPTVKEGRVYARGASDDKGQSYIHVKAVEAFLKTDSELPVNVKFVMEGEEEIGSPNLIPFVKEHRQMLKCDMVLISDTAMIGENQPSITYGLRGLAYMEMEVTGPNRDLHSGVYGGTILNPANVLADLISSLTDRNGRIRISGFYDDVKPLTDAEREAYRKLPFDEEAYKRELGIRDVYGEKGYSTPERASARPSLDVNGLWSGYQGSGAKTVLPESAGAKVSMRLVPDQEPGKIAQLFTNYINSVTPEAVSVQVTEHHGGFPVIVDL
ncbi:MAG: dipeptidase, partial [Balneolaceae bacterium]